MSISIHIYTVSLFHLQQNICIFPCRFCIQLRNEMPVSVIKPFTTILVRHINTHGNIIYNMCVYWQIILIYVRHLFQRNISISNHHVLLSLISAVGCLARDDVIRQKIAHDSRCWEAFVAGIVSMFIFSSDAKEIRRFSIALMSQLDIMDDCFVFIVGFVVFLCRGSAVHLNTKRSFTLYSA